MRSGQYEKGVFCLECDWYDHPVKRFSMEHILNIVDLLNKPKYDHIHYDVSTEEEFRFLLNKWAQKKYSSHPILYLGFHGVPGAIKLRNGKHAPMVTLEDLGQILKGKCQKRVIFFASCKTLHNKPYERSKFFEATGALAICGYKEYIDWMLSAAMDLIVLSAMQEHTFNLNGIRAIASRIKERASGLKNDLGFRIYTAQGEV
jgi:hypothetical protein